MRRIVLTLALLPLAFAPAPLPRRALAVDYQKVADAARWLSPDRDAVTSLERGGVLYRADFNPNASGCAVVAYDVNARKQLWRSKLKGIGLVSHSEYFNAVRVEPVDGEALAVYGQESAGRYVEIVSLKTGRTVGHKLFPRPGR